MVSQRQIEANRKNAARSTGPRTADGRATSSRNSRSHGLYSDPPAELVLAIYRLIVDNPEAHLMLQSSSSFELASLRLAEAEARLCIARKVDADQAAAYEKAVQRRGAGASIDAKPIYLAAKKMRQLSQKKLDRAMCGDISVVPPESLILYGPYWKLMKRIGFFDQGYTEHAARLGLMLYSEDAIFAIDNAGRGKLPRDNLRLRARLEGARSRALAAWLLEKASEQPSAREAACPKGLGRNMSGEFRS